MSELFVVDVFEGFVVVSVCVVFSVVSVGNSKVVVKDKPDGSSCFDVVVSITSRFDVVISDASLEDSPDSDDDFSRDDEVTSGDSSRFDTIFSDDIRFDVVIPLSLDPS